MSVITQSIAHLAWLHIKSTAIIGEIIWEVENDLESLCIPPNPHFAFILRLFTADVDLHSDASEDVFRDFLANLPIGT